VITPVRADVVVIGAGVAGLAAAVRLADAGRTVVVVEQAPRLGGRATSFVDRATGERVDNGQHALFGCYRETYAFLRRLGVDHLAPLQPGLSLTMADADGRRATLTCPDWPAPWHLVGGLLRWRAIGLADRASALRLAGVLHRFRRHGPSAVADAVPPHQTADDWLRARGQSGALRRWLWHPLAYAALNQAPDVAAAAPFVRVIGELFAPDPRAAAIGLPIVPLEDLFGPPAVGFVESRGGHVLMKSPATVIVGAGGGIEGVRAGEHVVSAPTVISAVPWHAFDRLFPNGVPSALESIAAEARAMRSASIVTVNLWFERSVTAEIGGPFIGLVDGPWHWAFDKSAIGGAAQSHVAVVASGADDLVAQDNERLTRAALAHLTSAVPALKPIRLRHAVVVREQRATFSLAPGGPSRPGTKTPLRGLLLAGDWTDTGLPGTIEGAVRSGHAAATEALA